VLVLPAEATDAGLTGKPRRAGPGSPPPECGPWLIRGCWAAMANRVESSMASTNPSPSVGRAARNSRRFSVVGMCSCASGRTARSFTMERPPMLAAPFVDRYGGIDEGAGAITMARPRSSVKLAGAAAHGVLVALRGRRARRFVDRAEAGCSRPVRSFIHLLVERESCRRVAPRWPLLTLLGTRICRRVWGYRTRRGLPWGSLRQQRGLYR